METTASAIKLPFRQAVEYFRQKVTIPTTHWTELMDEAHARAFTVAGATDKALLGDFRAAIDDAISQGTGYNKFRATFDELVEKYGWKHTGRADWRAKVIYRTNMSTAFAAGRYAQQTDPAVLAAFPYWQYQHVNCPNPRLQHVAWSGLVLRADDPWWNTNYPPNGWGCHCIVLSVGERALRDMGKSGPDKAPPLNWMTYVDRTTGVVSQYPAGVDPGFAYNPGLAWKKGQPAVVKTPNVKPEGAGPPPVLAPPGAREVRPDVLAAFLKTPADTGVQIGQMNAPGLANAAAPLVLAPAAVKEAAKANVTVTAALVTAIGAAAARDESNPHEKSKTIAVGELVARMEWDAEDAYWLITAIEARTQ